MKRLALVTPLYGKEATGSTAAYARRLAELLTQHYQVDVLTTRAIDAESWKNWYVRTVETVQGVRIRRFSVTHPKTLDFSTFDQQYQKQLEETGPDPAQEKIWFEKYGPCCPDCITYLKKNHNRYEAVLIVEFANYLTMMGLPEVAERSVLIPCVQQETPLRFQSSQVLFTLPQLLIFRSDEERQWIRRRFQTNRIPCVLAGSTADVPSSLNPAQFAQQHQIDAPYLIYVGKVSAEKDCPMMLHYFLEYKRRNASHLKLVLLGNVRCEIPRHPDILALGYVSEVEKYNGIAGAYAMVLPSATGNSAAVMLEAMSVSVPVLVQAANPVLCNHCRRSNAGLYYRDYFEFEGILRYLEQHPDQRDAMAVQAGIYVATQYDEAQMMQRLCRALNNVLQ